MGTRSTTKFYKNGGKHFIGAIYRQFDGYPTGHGTELKNMICGVKLVNGYTSVYAMKNCSNGIDCLAATIISKLKADAGIGGIYMTREEDAQEYNYKIWEEKNVIFISVKSALQFVTTSEYELDNGDSSNNSVIHVSK